jgi:hypothetical protein|uniref:Uncharacterized protein n=1 Tax=Picea glauca TaxID=3330 RepID=A0A117NJA2_PICGL|nr:hypothetical protein ABT39_MTgene988 [Picea glauca]QHR90890.1 hypothetical protein Q903MT_gene4917 [Picea sitchensis]
MPTGSVLPLPLAKDSTVESFVLAYMLNLNLEPYVCMVAYGSYLALGVTWTIRVAIRGEVSAVARVGK